MTAPSIERPTAQAVLQRPTEPPAAHPRPRISPVLTRLAAELPALGSALVCSADGTPLATYGLTTDDAAHLSVLASSVHGVSAATTKAHHGRPVDHVAIAGGGSLTVVLAIPGVAGHPLLAVTADDISLGRMLLLARGTAERVADALGRSAG